MKTPSWFTQNRSLSHLRIATAVALIFAAVAMGLFAARPSSAAPPSTGAQAFPKLKPLPPKKDTSILKATHALAPDSPWQLLTNQPPILDPPIAALATRFCSPMALSCYQIMGARIGGNSPQTSSAAM